MKRRCENWSGTFWNRWFSVNRATAAAWRSLERVSIKTRKSLLVNTLDESSQTCSGVGSDNLEHFEHNHLTLSAKKFSTQRSSVHLKRDSGVERPPKP